MKRLLPLAASVLVPAAVFGLVYLIQGENPAWGLVIGAIGLIGALSAEITRLIVGRRLAERAERERWQATQRERHKDDEQ